MKRNNFLKLGIGIPLLGMFSFKSISKELEIKKNPVIEFTPENLSEFNVGTYIIKDGADVITNLNWSTTVVYKLVWQITLQRPFKDKVKVLKYGMCNALTDGWTYWIGDKKELCDYLNNGPYGDKYRILTLEEMIYIIKNRVNQKQIVRHVI